MMAPGILSDPQEEPLLRGVMVDVIKKVLELQRKHFFVSKTDHRDSTLWHDYYLLPDDDKEIDLFIKLQKGKDGKCRVMSFRNNDEEG